MQGRKQGTQSLGSFRAGKLYGEQSQYSWQSAELPADLKEGILRMSSSHLNHCKMTKYFLELPPTVGRNIPIPTAILAEQIKTPLSSIKMVLMLQKASFAAWRAVSGIPFLTELSAF